MRHVLVDGGQLISGFLETGLINDMLLTIAPVLLGAGRPLFNPIEAGSRWKLDEVRRFPSGMINRGDARTG